MKTPDEIQAKAIEAINSGKPFVMVALTDTPMQILTETHVFNCEPSLMMMAIQSLTESFPLEAANALHRIFLGLSYQPTDQ